MKVAKTHIDLVVDCVLMTMTMTMMMTMMICSCISIKFLCEHMSMKWVLEHQLLFIKALLFVIMDLTGEVCPETVFLF